MKIFLTVFILASLLGCGTAGDGQEPFPLPGTLPNGPGLATPPPPDPTVPDADEGLDTEVLVVPDAAPPSDAATDAHNPKHHHRCHH